MKPFVLDRDSNPHPRMLAGALKARAASRVLSGGTIEAFWRGYLEAMADATGCTAEELEAWMDAHE